MQLYLDGFNNNFFTFFNVSEKKSLRINNNLVLKSQSYLKNKNISQITFNQKKQLKMYLENKTFHLGALQFKKEMKKH